MLIPAIAFGNKSAFLSDSAVLKGMFSEKIVSSFIVLIESQYV